MQELIQCCIISATAELNAELFSYLNFHELWVEWKGNFLQFFMKGAKNDYFISIQGWQSHADDSE